MVSSLLHLVSCSSLIKSKKKMPNTPESGPSTAQAAPEEPTYTTEQFEVVRLINEGKDPYQILGVTKESTDSDVKQAYKKLALKVHPDKNKAPGSVSEQCRGHSHRSREEDALRHVR